MVTNAYLIYHDGKLEVPEELREELCLREGARLRVVYSADQILLDRKERPAVRIGVTDWSQYEGILSDLDIDLNAELEKERIRENELDARL
jgi:bifunctional DNA-binding transcriptional regulator/antitoxin component of YhaV-PrlF toxin-antitoxin module